MRSLGPAKTGPSCELKCVLTHRASHENTFADYLYSISMQLNGKKEKRNEALCTSTAAVGQGSALSATRSPSRTRTDENRQLNRIWIMHLSRCSNAFFHHSTVWNRLIDFHGNYFKWMQSLECALFASIEFNRTIVYCLRFASPRERKRSRILLLKTIKMKKRKATEPAR